MQFSRTLKCTSDVDAGVYYSKSIVLDSTKLSAHLNFDIISSNGNGCSGTLLPKDAMALRDALIAAYPLAKEEPLARIANAHLEGFNLGRKFGYKEAEADSAAQSRRSKWEVVTDGLDRVKVEGGYIYQSDVGTQTFVPDTKPNAPATKPTCTYSGACSFRKHA